MGSESPVTEHSDAWHPGVGSGIPAAFRDLETLYRPEVVLAGRDEIEAAMSLTGLAAERLAVFRPDRLVLHELIARITAEIAVPEGEEEEDLGKNFRRIVLKILHEHLAPRLADIEASHAALCRRAEQAAADILRQALAPAPPPAPPARFSLGRLLGLGRSRPPAAPEPEPEPALVARFKALGQSEQDPEQRALYKSLQRILGAVLLTRGRLGADPALLARLVGQHVGNTYGSRIVGEAISPLVQAAIECEGLVRAPLRPKPVLISLKGPSAAGKSSIRPMVKQLMLEQGLEADRFITISPDIWRRLLLDFDSLGPATKYAGQFTSREVMVVDAKLDRYIRDKAERDQSIPDILVDRFRFDSFDSENVRRVLLKTYASHVHTMYMYFVVTPPAETVERGWRRALERGRYKSVEDFLAHSVEAYGGMPKMLLRWLAQPSPAYRYFFLDNRVPKGSFPTVAAAGDRQRMTIHDPRVLVDIERYQRTNIYATQAEEVAPPPDQLAVGRNVGFLTQCLRAVASVDFANRDGTPYLRARRGVFEVLDEAVLAEQCAQPEMAELFDCLPGFERRTLEAGLRNVERRST